MAHLITVIIGDFGNSLILAIVVTLILPSFIFCASCIGFGDEDTAFLSIRSCLARSVFCEFLFL